MPSLDPRTILVFAGLMGSLTAAVFLLVTRKHRPFLRKLDDWTAGFTAMFVAALLFSTRGALPAAISIVLANTLFIGGCAWVLWATQRFHGVARAAWPGVVVSCAAILLGWYTFAAPHYGRRLMVSSVALCAIAAGLWQIAWRHRRHSLASRIIAASAAGQFAIQFGRFVSSLDRPAVDDFWARTPDTLAYFLMYAFCVVLLMVGLVLLAAEQADDSVGARDAEIESSAILPTAEDLPEGAPAADVPAADAAADMRHETALTMAGDNLTRATHEADRLFAEQLRALAIGGMADDNFGVAQLARAMALSPRQLQRRCREVTGDGPLEFLRKIRIAHGRVLIRRRAFRTVGEVAAAVGMSPSYFARVYVATYGRPPSDDLAA